MSFSFLSISIYIVISNLRKSPAQLALKDCLSRGSLIFPQVWLRVTTFKKNNQKLTHKPFYTQVFFNMKASIISAWLLMLATTACISRVNGATGKEGCNRGLGLQPLSSYLGCPEHKFLQFVFKLICN